jgi:hypothetical protein
VLCRSRYSHTDFRKPGSEDEFYDIDFWANRKNGKLDFSQVKIHKVPVQEDGVWTKRPLYKRRGRHFRTARSLSVRLLARVCLLDQRIDLRLHRREGFSPRWLPRFDLP